DKIDAKFPEYELEQAQKLGRFEDEGLRIKKDGTTFYANVVITPLYDNNKQLIGFSKITRDLTERKMLEENLRQTNLALEAQVKERTMELEQRTKELGKTVVELKRINNDLDNFIYTASHDLKSPISNLEGLFYGLYEELEEQTKNNENIKTFKELIDVSIKRFQTTILELTEIAKVQKELVDYAEEVDLKELIEDVKISITDQINKTDAQIIVTLNNCDKIRFIRKNLKSIFYNLISNGIKYKSPDRTPIIKISCTNRENNYILTFEDNGLGLKEENMSKLFTMFKRFHDHVEGSGIGLYIIKRIIENAGGKIEVKSEEHVGTCFRIFIPKSIE
ncbi:MAG TPA: HAMP domain-containing sensor histidine kinase, partial [Cytophagaceae bacterium]